MIEKANAIKMEKYTKKKNKRKTLEIFYLKKEICIGFTTFGAHCAYCSTGSLISTFTGLSLSLLFQHLHTHKHLHYSLSYKQSKYLMSVLKKKKKK